MDTNYKSSTAFAERSNNSLFSPEAYDIMALCGAPYTFSIRENRPLSHAERSSCSFRSVETPRIYPLTKNIFLIMLYFGLRPCEVHTARIENGYLISRNAKRKGGKIEYKKIPISERIQGRINFSIDFSKTASVAVLEKKFNLIFPAEDLTPYCLRHTFATVCQQYVRSRYRRYLDGRQS